MNQKMDLLPDGLLSEKEMAQQLGRSVRTLRNWRASGTGPPFCRHPLSREILYDPELVRTWLAAGGRNQTRKEACANGE